MRIFLGLLEKQNALHLPIFSTFFSIFSIFFFFPTTFPEYWGIWSKKYFTDHQTADTIQLFVATKESFSGLFF